MQQPLTCVEICAGAGGQALGLAMAGFIHVALVEYEEDYCKVLKQNRPEWNVICADVHDFDGRPYHGVDLLAGGVPCPPFSVAGKQLGQEDERDLFPEAIRLIKEIQPRAVMLENVRGFLDPGFDEYRDHIFTSIQKLGYVTHIKLLNASDYGVPQLRPRVVIIGIRKDQIGAFAYPDEQPDSAPTVGDTLRDLMAQNTANTNAIVQSQTQGIQNIMDKLCQLELDGVKQENERLRTQLNMASLAASQTAQTAQILQGQNQQAQYITNTCCPKPIPSYTVPNPNCGCGGFGTCGA